MEKEQGIRYVPIMLFASVMGLAGMTISFQLAETLYGLHSIFSTILLIITLILFIINSFVLVYRILFYFKDVEADFKHPVKMNFYGTISISLLLLGVLFYGVNDSISFAIWLAGVIMQIGLTLIILSNVIWDVSFKLPQFNPTWFIPIVGNIVVPLAGVHHASATINWIFFSIGIVFTFIYLTIFINRIFFQSPLPKMLTPSYFILLAPLGIGVVSYMNLVGQVDAFVYILYGTAFYLGLLFIFQFRRFIRLPFFLSSWAYLFPTAAVTNATIYMYNETGDVFFSWLIPIQLVGLVVLTIYLLIKTTKLAINGSLTRIEK